MRDVWMSALVIPLVLSLTASEAAREPEGPESSFEGEVEYLGPVLNDLGIGQRLEQRESIAGVIEVYNTWTSFQRVRIKNNGSIVGHSYQICHNRHNQMVFAALIFAADGPIQIRSEHKLNKGGGTIPCNNEVLVPTVGFWLHTCTGPPTDIRPGFYKVTSRYIVVSGGSGSGKETARFDVFGSC